MATFKDANKTIVLTPYELNNGTFKNLVEATKGADLTPVGYAEVEGTNDYYILAGVADGTGIANFNAAKFDQNEQPDFTFPFIYCADAILTLFVALPVSLTNYRGDYKFNLIKATSVTEELLKGTCGGFTKEVKFVIATDEYYAKIKSALLLDLANLEPETTSETPATLVADNIGLETDEEEIGNKKWPKWVKIGIGYLDGDLIELKDLGRVWGEISPNPAKFGFTKQAIVDALPSVQNAHPDTLYLLKVFNNGELVGYRPYKWAVDEEDGKWAYRNVANTNIPNLKTKKGLHTTPKVASDNEPRKVFEKVFNGNVAINNGKLFINGKEVSTSGGASGGSGGKIIYSSSEYFNSIINQEEVNAGDILICKQEGVAVVDYKDDNLLEISVVKTNYPDSSSVSELDFHKVGGQWEQQQFENISYKKYVNLYAFDFGADFEELQDIDFEYEPIEYDGIMDSSTDRLFECIDSEIEIDVDDETYLCSKYQNIDYNQEDGFTITNIYAYAIPKGDLYTWYVKKEVLTTGPVCYIENYDTLINASLTTDVHESNGNTIYTVVTIETDNDIELVSYLTDTQIVEVGIVLDNSSIFDASSLSSFFNSTATPSGKAEVIHAIYCIANIRAWDTNTIFNLNQSGENIVYYFDNSNVTIPSGD